MKILFEDCQLISPDVEIEGASVLVENDRIRRIYACGDALPEDVDEVVELRGDYLMPGFVDVHCHGNSGYDFCDGTLEAITAIAEKKIEEGVTSFLPTTMTLGEETLAKALASAKAYCDKGSSGCKIPGVHLEGPFINPKCLGAQNPEFVRPPDIEEVLRLNKIFPVRKVSYAVEMPGGPEFAAELLEHGITPSCVHSAATFAQFQEGRAHGLRNLSHYCNQMTPLHHRDIGLVGAGLACEEVFLELICDTIHICPDMINLVFALKSTDRIQLITDAIRTAGLEDGEYNISGLSVVVKEGTARLKSNGALAGSSLKLNEALRNVYEITGLGLSELVKTTSWNQACALGLKDIGKIEPGYLADLVVLDGSMDVRAVYVNGIQKFGE